MDAGGHARVRWAVAAAVVAVLLAAILVPGAARLCEAASAKATDLGSRPINGSAGACAEFWLNRYQTLASGLLALAAAIVAALLLQKQLVANRMQVAAAMGDVDPDFFLEWDTAVDAAEGELEDGILRIQNFNRRPLTLRRIAIIDPPAAYIPAEFEIDAQGPKELRATQIAGNVFTFDRWIEGRDPAGPNMIDVIRLMIVDEGNRALAGQDQPMLVRVDYQLHGNPTEARQVDVRGLIRRR